MKIQPILGSLAILFIFGCATKPKVTLYPQPQAQVYTIGPEEQITRKPVYRIQIPGVDEITQTSKSEEHILYEIIPRSEQYAIAEIHNDPFRPPPPKPIENINPQLPK